MRILFVNEKLGFFGGVEQNIYDTARGLRGRGHWCALAYDHDTGRSLEQYASAFDRTLRVDMGAGASWKLDDALQQMSADVVYFHKVPILPDSSPASRAVRWVRMVHDHDLTCPRRHKYFAFSNKVCKHRLDWRCWCDLAFVRKRPGGGKLPVQYFSIPRAKRELDRNCGLLSEALVGSNFMKQQMVCNGLAASRVNIVPPVVVAPDVKVTPVGDAPNILYVGQLIRGKGVDLLLHAMAKLKCDFRADIVGTGNADGKLKALCGRLGLDSRVHFAGFVPHDRLGEYYARAKVLAVPSRWPEPFGMIGLEAMHYARPVVATAVGGIPDWLDDGVTGLLAPEQDVQALADAMTRLLLDTDLANRMGHAGRERVLRMYRFEDYLATLEQLLAGQKAEAH